MMRNYDSQGYIGCFLDIFYMAATLPIPMEFSSEQFPIYLTERKRVKRRQDL